MIKATPHPNYPAEAGRYIRGNDASPVALVVVLNTDEDKIPLDLEKLVRAGTESGAALDGRITWRVTQPWCEPDNDAERATLDRAKALMEKLKSRKLTRYDHD